MGFRDDRCVRDSAIAPPYVTMTPAPRAVMGSTPNHSFHLARFLCLKAHAIQAGRCRPTTVPMLS